MNLEYDTVIATRNRPGALRLSIPCILGQCRKPRKIIVVDSSSDHESVRVAIQPFLGTGEVELEMVRSAPGLPRQRNVGLERVRAPVVMFPDDDSMWFPGVADSIMRVYERDTDGDIGAVCAADSPVAPAEFTAAPNKHYAMTVGDKIKQTFSHRRAAVERSVFPDPFILHGRSRWQVRPLPGWAQDESVVPVEWMTGFRMSFRTDLIRRRGFDETLQGYALFEDVDASFGIMRDHLVVGARKAMVYHHRFPGKRDNGFAVGALQLLNRVYVICRNAAPTSSARRHLRRYGLYKLAQYAMGCRGRFGRERLAGARWALGVMHRLLETSEEKLSCEYTRLHNEILESRNAPAVGIREA